MDFEEFVIFLQALTSTAAKYFKSIPEFLFPDLVKQAEGFDNGEEPGRGMRRLSRARAACIRLFCLSGGPKGPCDALGQQQPGLCADILNCFH